LLELHLVVPDGGLPASDERAGHPPAGVDLAASEGEVSDVGAAWWWWRSASRIRVITASCCWVVVMTAIAQPDGDNTASCNHRVPRRQQPVAQMNVTHRI
jgi:hypothetical protein